MTPEDQKRWESIKHAVERDVRWAVRFIKLAEHVAEWSKDPSTKVGAVIVDDDRRVISLGYNGFPRNVRDDDDRYADRPTKYKMIVHSEVNAILSADRPVRGTTLYTTLFPCSECAKIIVQSGIRKIVFSERLKGSWIDDANFSATMMEEAFIEIYQLDQSDIILRLIDYSTLRRVL